MHDSEAAVWVDLVSGLLITLPEGTYWSNNFMVLPDEVNHFTSAVPYGSTMYFKECGALTIITLQEVIDLYSDYSSVPMAVECGYAGFT